jgi:predicted transcriptional regulator
MICINEVLLNVLIDENVEQISVNDLKKIYLNFCPQVSNRDAGQLIHRTLRKLCKKNFLLRNNQGKIATYHKTRLFDKASLQATTGNIKSDGRPRVYTPSEHSNLLCTTLEQYQFDLITLTSEVEELKNLLNKLPIVKQDIYPILVEARNQSYMFIGKIKAVEACLNALKNNL